MICWKEWFEYWGSRLRRVDHNDQRGASAEDMYQAFKARLIEELKVNGGEILAGGLGDLVDTMEKTDGT